MSAPVSSSSAALAELRAVAADSARTLARSDWRASTRQQTAAPRMPVGTAHARDRAKCESSFTNQVLAERFDAAHSVGQLRVLPRTDGKYVVHDYRKPLGQGCVAGPFEGHLALERADAAMRQLATEEGIGS